MLKCASYFFPESSLAAFCVSRDVLSGSGILFPGATLIPSQVCAPGSCWHAVAGMLALLLAVVANTPSGGTQMQSRFR